MNIPKITLIISTLNAGKNLEKTIISYLGQSHRNKELIIIDGESVDSTNQIVSKYKDIIYYSCSEKDKGVYDAWNKGLSICNGKWVCFLGAGDEFYSKDTLSDLIKLSNDEKINFISGKIYLHDQNGNYIEDLGREWSYRKISSQIVIGHPGSLHKKILFKKYGLFNSDYKISGDHEFLIRVGKNIESKYLRNYVVKMDNCGISKTNPSKAIFESAKALKDNRNFGFLSSIKFLIIAFIKYNVKNILIKLKLLNFFKYN